MSYPSMVEGEGNFVGAADLNRIMGETILMDPKRVPEIRELTDAAKKAIAKAIQELETKPCKTFNSIDELFEDLESD